MDVTEHDILLACSIGDIYWLKKSLNGKEKHINEIFTNEGLTPLHIAAYQRNSTLIEYLIIQCKGIDINVLTLYTGDTPLHLLLSTGASSGSSTVGHMNEVMECALILLNKGADYDKQNLAGQTPLHLAAKSGLTSVVELLIEQGADITITDHRNQTPNDMARLYGSHDCCRLLTALHWAKDKDNLLRHRLQTEKQNNKEREYQRNLQERMKQKRGTLAYEAWLEHNQFSPSPLLSSTSKIDTSQTRLSCKTCSSIRTTKSTSPQSQITTTEETIQSNEIPSSTRMIPKIQISLNQADHNIKPIGKPDQLYPYSNYPPSQYRVHSAGRRQRDHVIYRPRSCASGRGEVSSSKKHEKQNTRNIKSAPILRVVTTPSSVSKTSKISHVTNTSLAMQSIDCVGTEIRTVGGQKREGWKQEKGVRRKKSGKRVEMVAIKTEGEIEGEELVEKKEERKEEEKGKDDKESEKEKDRKEKDRKEEKEEEGMEKEKERKEGEEVSKSLVKDEEDQGSTTSLDGLTFHEVGQENDLQSLVSPTTGREGEGELSREGGLEGAGLFAINPIELLHVFAERSSKKSRHYNKHRSSRQTSMIKKPTGLVSIPEGEYVTCYNEIEDSQLFDTDFLYSLMPFAFDNNLFQPVDDSLVPGAPPTSPHEPHPPLVFPNEPHPPPSSPPEPHPPPTFPNMSSNQPHPPPSFPHEPHPPPSSPHEPHPPPTSPHEPLPPPTSPNEPHLPTPFKPYLFKQAWDTPTLISPQTPLTTAQLAHEIVPKINTSSCSKRTPICSTSKIPLRTSIFEFGGNVNYN